MIMPEEIDIEKIYNFYEKLKLKFKLGEKLITHIKFPEYSISIPENKDEFHSIFNDNDWNDISYISFFMKGFFFINFDFLEEKIQINCENADLEKEIKDFINLYFNIKP